jgi:hypothetical protein
MSYKNPDKLKKKKKSFKKVFKTKAASEKVPEKKLQNSKDRPVA